jgi:hypothetical protein
MENSSFAEEVKFLKENGYVVFKKHATEADCDLLANVAVKTLFSMAFGSQKDAPEPSFENLKFFAYPEERKKLKSPACIWVNGKAAQPLCSKVTGLCYGSYIKEVQEKFTMTFNTYEKLAACYETTEIAQIYGPKSYTIRMQGGHKGQTMMDCNLMSDFNNVCVDEKILSSLIVSVSETGPIVDSGTICVIPRFHLYKRHARLYFNFVGGQKKLPLNLASPTIFEDDFFEENLEPFNKFLSELHKIRDKKLRASEVHEPYLKLLSLLPKRFQPLKWHNIKVSKGDLLCRSQWLPYYENMCEAKIPFIAFHVAYYKIPKDFLGSYKQRRLIAAIELGHTMDECKEWEKAKNNTYETYLRRRCEDESTYFYVPKDDDDLDFAMLIQCLDPDLTTTQFGVDLE